MDASAWQQTIKPLGLQQIFKDAALWNMKFRIATPVLAKTPMAWVSLL
jgi:hypothetical protein